MHNVCRRQHSFRIHDRSWSLPCAACFTNHNYNCRLSSTARCWTSSVNAAAECLSNANQCADVAVAVHCMALRLPAEHTARLGYTRCCGSAVMRNMTLPNNRHSRANTMSVTGQATTDILRGLRLLPGTACHVLFPVKHSVQACRDQAAVKLDEPRFLVFSCDGLRNKRCTSARAVTVTVIGNHYLYIKIIQDVYYPYISHSQLLVCISLVYLQNGE